MPAFLRTAVGSLSTREVPPLLEEDAEAQGALSFVALICPSKRSLRIAQLTLLLEQDAELEGSGTVA